MAKRIFSAEDLDRMTPDERDAAFDDRIVHDLDELRPEFRRRIVAEAQRLGEELRRTERP